MIRATLRLWLVFLLGLWTGQAAAVSDAAILERKPPKLLSEFGFFADLTAQRPAAGVVPFAPATPLFTDYALKKRFVYVPEGKMAVYNEEEAFAFPVGSALIKTFAYPRKGEDTDGSALDLIETRLLLRQADGWQSWAYLWNETDTDAELKITGAKLSMEITTPDGSTVSFTYAMPNKNQCKACHAINGELIPIGPKARNLNADFTYAEGVQNQLAHWSGIGILEGAPTPSDAPSVPDWTNEATPIDARARAWLDINCAHCHRRDGPASNSGLFLDWNEDDRTALGIGKRPVAAGRGSGGLEFDIVPGEPDSSILLYRVKSVEPGVMMPEIGRSLEQTDAVKLLGKWIGNLQ